MGAKNENAPSRSRSVREIIDQANDLWKIAKIVVKMSEEERADFFDWWNYSRFEDASAVDDATKHIRRLARKIKKSVL
jgi:hypothetical protein